MDIGFSLKKGFEILRKNPVMLFFASMDFIITSIFYVFNAVYSETIAKSIAINAETGAPIMDTGLLLTYLAAFLISLLLVVVVSTLLSSGVVMFSYESLKGKSSLEVALGRALRRLPYVLAASFLYFIAILAALLIALTSVLIPICCGLFMIVSVILAAYVAIRLVFYMYPIVIFEVGAIDGLSESWELTRGRVIEVFVLILVLSFIGMPLALAQYIPPEYLLLALPVLFLSSVIKMWGTSVMTLAYLQLAGKYGKNGLIREKEGFSVGDVPGKIVLLIGFDTEEVRSIGDIGFPLYPVSEYAREVPLAEILKTPSSYVGDASWLDGKFVIMHGLDGDEIEKVVEEIGSQIEGRVGFVTSTETSLLWTLGYLLREISRPP